MSDKSNKEIADILKRLQRLEDAVFPMKKKTVSKEDAHDGAFSGPKGGALLLLSKGFFLKQRSVAQVVTELQGMGYVGYQRQVVQNALNRLSANKGPLIASTESGVRMYAKRK